MLLGRQKNFPRGKEKKEGRVRLEATPRCGPLLPRLRGPTPARAAAQTSVGAAFFLKKLTFFLLKFFFFVFFSYFFAFFVSFALVWLCFGFFKKNLLFRFCATVFYFIFTFSSHVFVLIFLLFFSSRCLVFVLLFFEEKNSSKSKPS